MQNISAKEQYYAERLHAMAPASPHIKPIKIMRIKTLTIFMHSHFCICMYQTAIRMQLHSVCSFRVFRFHSEIRVEAQFYCLTYLCWAFYSDVGVANVHRAFAHTQNCSCKPHRHCNSNICFCFSSYLNVRRTDAFLRRLSVRALQTPVASNSTPTVNWRLIHFVRMRRDSESCRNFHK